MKLSTLKPSKSSLVFTLSILMGAVGVFYSQNYIESQVDFYKGQLEKTEEMVQVVVPRRALARGHSLRSGDLSLREIPVKYADANALTESSYQAAIGQRLAFDLSEGRPLLWAHLDGGRSPTFSGMVPEGSRALTVRVDEINSISGFLQPSDRIDLLLTHGTGSSNAVFPIIQKLVVIATGVQTQVIKNGQGGKRVFNTITVNVSPENAKKITLAQKIGKLTAVLRNPDDDSPLSDIPMTTARLFNKPVRSKPVKRVVKVVPPKPQIEYIIGGGA